MSSRPVNSKLWARKDDTIRPCLKTKQPSQSNNKALGNTLFHCFLQISTKPIYQALEVVEVLFSNGQFFICSPPQSKEKHCDGCHQGGRALGKRVGLC